MAVRNRPAAFVHGANPKLFGNLGQTPVGSAVQSAAQALQSAQTIGDVENVLARSAITGILPMAQKKSWNAYDPQGALNMSVQSYAGIVEDMPGYVPGKGSFLSWALGKVGIGRQSKMLADEFAQKPYGSPNFDQFEAWNEAMEEASKSEPLTNVLDPGFGLQGQYSLESLLPENLTTGEQLGGFNYVQQKVIERAAKVSKTQMDLINARIAGPALNDQMMTRAAAAAAYDQRWGGDWMQRKLEAFNQSSSTDRYPTPFMGSTIDLTREEVSRPGIPGIRTKNAAAPVPGSRSGHECGEQSDRHELCLSGVRQAGRPLGNDLRRNHSRRKNRNDAMGQRGREDKGSEHRRRCCISVRGANALRSGHSKRLPGQPAKSRGTQSMVETRGLVNGLGTTRIRKTRPWLPDPIPVSWHGGWRGRQKCILGYEKGRQDVRSIRGRRRFQPDRRILE